MIEMKVLSVVDNDDGSATVQLEMDWDTVVLFAKIGILKALQDSVKDVDNEQR